MSQILHMLLEMRTQGYFYYLLSITVVENHGHIIVTIFPLPLGSKEKASNILDDLTLTLTSQANDLRQLFCFHFVKVLVRINYNLSLAWQQ